MGGVTARGDTAFSAMLKGRFQASNPSREEFETALLKYAVARSPRKNNGSTADAVRKRIDRWVSGASLPGRKYQGVVASVLDDSSIPDLCAKKRLPKVYGFRSSPFVIVSAQKLLDGNTTEHPADRRAYELIRADFRSSKHGELGTPIVSGRSGCPTELAVGDFILICGPNGNSLASQLNNFFSTSEEKYFYFLALQQLSSEPDLCNVRDNWAISHSAMPEMRMTLPPSSGGDTVDDYGVYYIGPNPEAEDCRVVWIAGLGDHGTVGATIAFLEQRDRIVEELTRNRYVSALVRCQVHRDYTKSHTIEVIYVKPT